MSDAAGNVEWLWTWGGSSFGYRAGNDLWTYDGRHVGQFQGDNIYRADGSYLGERLGSDRLITAKFRIGIHRARFPVLPTRTRSLRRTSLPDYAVPTGFEDFPLPEKLP